MTFLEEYLNQSTLKLIKVLKTSAPTTATRISSKERNLEWRAYVPSTRICNASNKKDQHNKANIMQSRQVYMIQEMVVRAYQDQLLNTQRPFPYLILLSCRFSYSEQQPPNQNEDATDK